MLELRSLSGHLCLPMLELRGLSGNRLLGDTKFFSKVSNNIQRPVIFGHIYLGRIWWFTDLFDLTQQP